MKKRFGVDQMPQTTENFAEDFNVSREDQDTFPARSQAKAAAALSNGRLGREITPVVIPQRNGDPLVVYKDEHPRATTVEALAKLPTPFREGGNVNAGNASGVNDGAAALIIASEEATRHGLTPIARIMGIAPVPASEKLMTRLGMTRDKFDVIELNEAFASQALAVLRQLGISDDVPRINPHGGAIALGHSIGASGARITGSAACRDTGSLLPMDGVQSALVGVSLSRWSTSDVDVVRDDCRQRSLPSSSRSTPELDTQSLFPPVCINYGRSTS